MKDLKFVRDPETGLIIPEKWKYIRGYKKKYQISNYGRVKSYYRKPPIIMKLSSRNSVGYIQVSLSLDGERRTHLVHRLVLSHFNREPEVGEETNHKDGNKENNFIDNLEWTDRKSNVNHSLQKGLSSNIGETHSKAKLSKSDVEEIKNLYPTGDYTQKELGDKFGVHQATIADILHGRSWSHVN